ncbi:hypothetical protein AMATHDRAFT_62578 [Amanita thiersii Skay4041]|uniref:Uncharacterized protein n=1 Tax=Amanita thiersii Skay4041 TaxID=703135 RepID=A0A2A9NGI2_9AGAR|nr:hypothetical protein AMATHDRAFT_62578 [Amanita thiersii Skay4041]
MTLDSHPQHLNGTLRDGLYIKHMPSCYSSLQAAQYLDRIGFSPAEYVSEAVIAAGKFPATLENLERIMRLHSCTVPFENTEIHYSPEHIVGVDPQYLFRRLVDEDMGSDCLGLNLFLLGILRRLGYRGYNVAARVNLNGKADSHEISSSIHLMILVQPFASSNLTYLVDVAFGPTSTSPILLSDAEDNIVTGISSTERIRLRRWVDPRSSLETRPGLTKQNWVVEVQHLKGKDLDPATTSWTPFFMFPEQEFYAQDIIDGSFVVSLEPSGILYKNLMIVKHFLLDEEGKMIFDSSPMERRKGDIIKRDLGRVVLFGPQLKFITGPQSQVRELKSEQERVQVIRDTFGIMIEDDEIRFMEGRDAALPVRF